MGVKTFCFALAPVNEVKAKTKTAARDYKHCKKKVEWVVASG